MAPRLAFHPVTKARWSDFEALFESRGAPSYCWCMSWRATPEDSKLGSGRERKPMMKARVEAGTTVGLLGYLEGRPVAWVSVAPRETYRELGGPPAGEETVWSLVCMYIDRALRGQGYGLELIEAARDYARRRGGTVLEAYPVDPESPSYRFMGFVPAFQRLGFETVGRAGSRRHLMRLTL
ncbi:MAG TPA: GNAT family N-acetyltransferase [Devosia sp.]|nr:GNAT family N-acetyltransferase [Devosia sp.]